MLPQPSSSGEARREAGLAPPQSAGARWRHAFGLAVPYWRSADWKFAWTALILLIALQFGNAYIFVTYNRWQQHFFDSVEQRRIAEFGGLVLAFFGVMGMQVGSELAKTWLQMNLGIRWRTFLTGRYLDRWLGNNRFAEIERLRVIDNPDQRIAVDIAAFTGTAGVLGLLLGLLQNVVTAVSFVFILLETAEPIDLSLFGHTLSIPGSTVWYAFLYAFGGSYLIAKIGGPYIRAKMRQQHVEADFRANLIHVRRNAGQIGLGGAVPVERVSLGQTFDQVRHNYRTIIYRLLGISLGSNIYDRGSGMLPLFLMVPRYFAGAISFGQMMGARDAFQTLVGNLSYFVHSFSSIAEQVANVNRLKALDDAIDSKRPRGIALDAGDTASATLVATGLGVHRPNGAPMLTVDDWTVRAGERWMVEGPSGSGKSTLLRAVAGLWPDGHGRIALATGGRVMFVPQRLYLPLGTLKAAICFPDVVEAHDDAAIVALLERVRLTVHADNLHAVRIWQEELSPGEQQRIALARILLHRPTMLVLDEATSALDPDNAGHFYEQLLGDLPDVTLIGVVHDDRLRRFHTHRLAIVDGQATPGTIPEDAA